jgi:DNA polymerase elongation subunit (family B)
MGAILREFCDYVLTKDPDILVSSYQGLERNTIDHLLARMSAYEFNFGRDGDKITRVQGRVCLDTKSFHLDLDLSALIERARFGFLPLQIASRYGMNSLIDSKNCYELIQRNFVIPASRSNYRYDSIRTLEEIVTKDKGGMIFSPQVGLHENVVVLDYENEKLNPPAQFELRNH